jgi:hypothetical protein
MREEPMPRLLRTILAAAALAGLAPTGASADPDELMPCKVLLIKAPPAAGGDGLTKFVCKPPTGGSFVLPSAAAAPTGFGVFVDANVVPPGTPLFPSFSIGAPCTGLGNPAGSKGYKCTSFPEPGSPPSVPVVLIKEKVVKAVVRFDIPLLSYQSGHPYAATSDVAIRVISVGDDDEKHYCGRVGGDPPIKNDATQYRRKNAPAPTACSPSGAFLDEGEAPL